MYFFYVDEAGNRDPRIAIPRADGSTINGDPVYVLTAVSLFEHRWHGFEKTINRHKSMLMDLIHRNTRLKLQLADCEIKSNWIRIPKERAKRPFLTHITDVELTKLVDLYFEQLRHHHMTIFAVIVDKRCLHDYMDPAKLHRKAWELLLETVEQFMRTQHSKHQALMVTDDMTVQENRTLAMKHAYIMDKGTARNTWLRHICEMPMFVRSELSNGVQLADLCAYNIYRVFKMKNIEYPFFTKISHAIWSRHELVDRPFSRLHVFPPESELHLLVEKFEKTEPRPIKAEARSGWCPAGFPYRADLRHRTIASIDYIP
ncbi:MAG: DUF3800 domain-containing protein [Phycisphaerales bacterium]|nr:DUF3800 domain-containing protein [Phycisphaerales bacterium]